MDEYSIKAYAKINLGLDVTGRLPDGYHQVKMIMQSIDLWDELSFRKTERGITLQSDCAGLPSDRGNLAYRAAELLFEKYGIGRGVHICLRKRIPVAAGMAGGSTDAAAALKGINRLFDLRLSPKQLREYGRSLGADIPYCLLGGTALAEGTGEKLTPLPPLPDCLFLVAKPKADISTKYVYEHLDAREPGSHPDIDGMTEAIRRQDLPGVFRRMENVLETVTVPLCPVIDTIKARMLELGASASLMSGSGPTVFGIFPPGRQESAGEAFRTLKQEMPEEQLFLVPPAPPCRL